MNIEVGQYWRCVDPNYDNDIEHDSIVIIADTSASEIQFEHGGYTYTEEVQAFVDAFRYAEDYDPDREITDKIHSLLNEFNNVSNKQQKLSGEIQSANTTAIALADSASAKKELMKRAKKDMNQLLTEADRIRHEIQEVIEKKQSIIRQKMNALEKTVSFMEEGIWSINLYLGVGEDIVQIMEGDPAAMEDKVVIRQKLLFMDEEAAIDLCDDDRHFDADKIEEFDEWIKDPEHLQQVLPERKGVVALRVRKNYPEPI